MKPAVFLAVLLAIVIFVTSQVSRCQPVIENRTTHWTVSDDPQSIYAEAFAVGDPTFSSMMIFGNLDTPQEVDLYMFSPRESRDIPFELFVPVRVSNRYFLPSLTIIGSVLPPVGTSDPPIPIPLGHDSITVHSLEPELRPIRYESFGLQRLYGGTSLTVPMVPYSIYYIAVSDPSGTTGSYVLSLGSGVNHVQSVLDTRVRVNPDSVVFAHSLNRAGTADTKPSLHERTMFPDRLTPFMALDTRIKLWASYINFFIFRLSRLFV